MEGFTYNTLKTNREKLINDCRNIAEKIDDYEGEILYLNYDIGTGKSRAVAENIAAKLYQRKKILILIYSYLIGEEWKQRILNQDHLAKIFILTHPMSKYSYCLNKNETYKEKSLENIDQNFCWNTEQRCEQIHNDCPGNYKVKINESQIVITSNQLFIKNKELFVDFDLIIFDEVNTLDITTEKSLHNFNDLFKVNKYIQCSELIDDNYLKLQLLCKKYTDIQHEWSTPMLSDIATGDISYDPIPITEEFGIPVDYLIKLKSIFKEERKSILKEEKKNKIKEEKKNKIKEEKKNKGEKKSKIKGEKKIKIKGERKSKIKGESISNIYDEKKNAITKAFRVINDLIVLFTNSNSTFIYPKMRYILKVNLDDYGRFIKVKVRAYSGASLLSKTKFDMDRFFKPQSESRPATVLVLSALNTKEYIEYIFAQRIKEQNCFGHKVLNMFPNVITTNYHHLSHKYASYTKKTQAYFEKEHDRNQLKETIEAFVNSYKNEKVIIAGSKSLIKIINTQFKDKNKYNIDIKEYDKFMLLDATAQNNSIPFVHFGMSGTNEFADFRAMLVINEYIIPDHLHLLYTDKNYHFNITEDDFHFNLQIAPARQLEGRLLRFTDKIIIKHIHRLNYYDYDYKNSSLFPNLSNPYMIFKQFESLKYYLNNRENEVNYKDFIRNKENTKILSRTQHIQTELWKSLFRNKPEITDKYDKDKSNSNSKKELYFLIKMIHYLLKLIETGETIEQISHLLYKYMYTMINLKSRSNNKRIKTQLLLLENIDLSHLCIDNFDEDFIKAVTQNIRNYL